MHFAINNYQADARFSINTSLLKTADIRYSNLLPLGRRGAI